MFVVYVLESETFKRTYTGMTNDLERLIKEHNNGKTKSTRFYRPWKLLFIESFPTRLEAREREKYLKSGIGRDYIKKWPRSSAGYLPAAGREQQPSKSLKKN